MPPGCDCARVVLGKIYPNQCILYGRACTPRKPVGPCMVSDEGACRIWWASGVSEPARTGMTRQARDIIVTGRVQGVGYRPFVYVTAHELGITGSVLNGSGKVFIHAEGAAADLDRLEAALVGQAPPLARPRLASSKAGRADGRRRPSKSWPATPRPSPRSTCRRTCSPATIAWPN